MVSQDLHHIVWLTSKLTDPGEAHVFTRAVSLQVARTAAQMSLPSRVTYEWSKSDSERSSSLGTYVCSRVTHDDSWPMIVAEEADRATL